MALGKVQLPLWEKTSSQCWSQWSSQRVQEKHCPFEKPSKSAAATARARGDGTRQELSHWEIHSCPYGAAPGEKACWGRLGSPVCWAPWGSSCGSASPGGDSQGSPQGRQGPPAQQPALTGSNLAVWLLVRAVKEKERPLLHKTTQGVWLEGHGTGTFSNKGAGGRGPS